MSTELVVGVDVGSQGTCAQAIASDGELVATSYVPHRLSYPQPGVGRAGPDRVARRRRSGARRGSPGDERASLARRVVRIATRRPRGGDGSGEPTGPALIWMDRRAGSECDQVASRFRPERLRELTGCNLDPGHVAAKISWLRRHRAEEHAAASWFLLPGSFVAWRASGELAVDPSNASSTMLLDIRTLRLVLGGVLALRGRARSPGADPGRPRCARPGGARGCATQRDSTRDGRRARLR